MKYIPGNQESLMSFFLHQVLFGGCPQTVSFLFVQTFFSTPKKFSPHFSPYLLLPSLSSPFLFPPSAPWLLTGWRVSEGEEEWERRWDWKNEKINLVSCLRSADKVLSFFLSVFFVLTFPLIISSSQTHLPISFSSPLSSFFVFS